jgi:4-amino-4-deoxy-L-arabinose transferase-like glycosyltransferase
MNSRLENHPVYFLLFLVFIYFICFYQLDSFCMLDWDESRVAKSSYELSKSDDMVIVTYQDQPDLWSTKPPFLNWVQAIFIKTLGLNELAVRLPSAFAGAGLLLFLFFYLKKNFGDIFLAYLVPLILGTSGGFYQLDHSFRSADYDGMLTFFLFLGCMSFFSYLQFNPHKKTLLYLSFLFFSLAVLTKGIAGFFLFPGLFIYCITSKKILQLIKTPHFYFSFLVFLMISFGFYFLREVKLPGYIKAVNTMELFGRYNNTFDNHSKEVNIWLNFTHLMDNRFNLYYLLIPFSLAIMPFLKNYAFKSLVLFSNIISFSLLGILLLSKSKNTWYDLPAIPFLSINAGLSLVIIRDLISEKIDWYKHFMRDVSYSVILTFIFCFGFVGALINIYAPPSTKTASYKYSTVVQNYIKQHRAAKNSIYLAELTQSQAFYFDIANNKQGLNLKTGSYKDIEIGKTYITAHDYVQQQVESNYNFTLLDTYDEIKVYRIISLKKS